MMIQSQATPTLISTMLQPPVAAGTSETSAIPTSTVSDIAGETPQWQAVMVAEQVRTGQSYSPKSKKRSSSQSLSPPARTRAGEEDAEPVTPGTATSVGTSRLPSGIRIGSQTRPRSLKQTMESRIRTIENQLVHLESRMDAADATVSDNQIELDNVRQEI